MAAGVTRKQHYNPRLLLRGFAIERKPGKFQTQVFDKHQERAYPAAIENIAAERDFNTADIGDATVDWEPKLTRIEDRAAPIVQRIRDTERLDWITVENKAALSVFAATQFVRGTDYRARFAHLGQMMREHLAEAAGEDAPAPTELIEAFEENEARASSLHALENNLTGFATCFAVKHLMLFKAASGASFLIGDSPLALHNEKTFGPYGNLGLAVTGIQISLPISSELTLAFWCPSYLEEIHKAIIDAEELLAPGAYEISAHDREVATAGLARLRAVYDDFNQGLPRLCDADNVTFLNSLQIKNAERFVMSRDGDFSLVTRMLADNPKFKTGTRMTLG
jgi:hypothetical protein